MVAKKAQQVQQLAQPRYAFWFSALFVTLLLTFAPFNKALFNLSFLQFENPIYYAILFGAITLLVVAISLYFNKKSPVNDPILHILVWLIPLSLFISSLSPVSHSLAVNGVYIYLFLAGMFVLARYLASETHGHTVLTYGLIGTSYIIVIFGFMNWFGDASFFGLKNWSEDPSQISRVYKDAVQVDSNGPRLASVFQYANTYAGYLTGVLFATLYLMVTSKRRSILVVSSLLLVPIFLSMLLTLSRGGWAAALVSYLIILIFIRVHKQILMLIYSLIGVVVTIVIFNYINQTGNDLRELFSASTYTVAWLILIGASAFMTLITLVLHRYSYSYIRNKFVRFSTKRLASTIIPFLLLLIGILMGYLVLQDSPINRALPDNLEQRVDNINLNQHSVLERGTFYSDAWKLYKDYPIFGAGSGAWSTLYEQYQNNPYTSRLAHSFIMQHLVETGMLGTIILLAFLILVLYQFITRLTTWNGVDNESSDPRMPYFLFGLPIFIHSMIDFDMSFIYLGAVVFLCLGAMTANSKPVFTITKQSFVTKWQRIYPVTLIILSLVMLIGTIQLLRANKLHNNVITSTPSIEHIQDTFNHILKIREGNPYFTLSNSQLLNQLYTQTNDESYYKEHLEIINHSLVYEPFNLELIKIKLELLLFKKELEQAYSLTNQALIYFPWNVAFYEKNMVLAIQLLGNEINAQDWTHSQPYIQTVISTYNLLNKQIAHLTTLPEGQLQGQPFLTTPTIELTAAKAFYFNNDFKAAESILKPLVNADQLQEPVQREISRWYLSSLVRQGMDDPDLLQQLASADSDELTKLQQLNSIVIPE